MTRLNNVRLLVDDVPATAAFYHDALGLEPNWGTAENGYLGFEGLSLFGREGQEGAMGVPVARGPLLVLEVDDVDLAVDRLRSRGVEIVAVPTDQPDWGIRVAHVRDPEGNLVELMTRLPRERWSAWLLEQDSRYSKA